VATDLEGFAAPPDAIAIHGAREHNLQNLSLTIPRDRFVVVTGVSGSGKSTLAFDLVFAEGQRRFLDSMNAYARQFVEQLARPDVDLIAGIPPTVSIEQRNTRGGGKSTVATVTEVYHFVRLLYARLGRQHCPDCQQPVEPQTPDAIRTRLRSELRQRGPLDLLAPLVRGRKGFHTDIGEWAARHGYAELRVDGRPHATADPLRLDRFREHTIEVVVGRLDTRAHARTADRPAAGQTLVDDALRIGRGVLLARDRRDRISVHSTEFACAGCGRSFQPLDPKFFSYNSSAGWCPRCRGFGELFYLPEDVDRGARADAIEESWFGWQEGKREVCPDCQGNRLNPVARAVRLPLASPPGCSPHLRNEPTLDALGRATVVEAYDFFQRLALRDRAALIARDILPEIRERLRFLDEVGLGYLELGRAVTTLSGGEAQRIRLAAQLGSTLSGVLYVLDEPTIGLHARDNARLLDALAKLRARGNSLLVVEHDEATMRQADYIIDLGPGAGIHGGRVVAAGTLDELLRHTDSITGQCLRAIRRYPSRGHRRPVVPSPGAIPEQATGPTRRGRAPRSGAGNPAMTGESAGATVAPAWLVLDGAAVHNLKHVTVRIPLGRLVLVTGVSGSGKSTLVRECLIPALANRLGRRASVAADALESPPDPPPPAGRPAPAGGAITAGADRIQGVYEVDQSPIGRTPRSIPATYVGFFDDIRALFAQVPEARMRGYGPGRFSFNSAEGRCPACEGAGLTKLEMNFLPPAFVKCENCQGLRFNPETLDIHFNSHNIAQVLGLSVAEARELFAAFPRIRRPLDALHDTGLDYLKLGQTSPTLSGGEAQRVKLVTHLLAGLPHTAAPGRRAGRHNLFVLEEPTIGLHMADVQRLVEVLQRLVDAGHTVLVIEHNLDLIAEADWVIDLGPEGGAAGGEVVAAGTPESVAGNKRSHTGRFLRNVLARR
jgi:excinuclease ABC subunit A